MSGFSATSGISSFLGGQRPDFSAIRDQLFKNADTDKSGDISKAEFTEIGKKLPKIGNDDPSKLFDTIDSDGNGALSKDEVKAFDDRISKETQSGLLDLQSQFGAGGIGGGFPGGPGGVGGGFDPSQLFAQADSDGNGSVSQSEFGAKAGGSHKAGGSKDLLNTLFKIIDSNGDGSISKDENSSFAKKAQHHAHKSSGAVSFDLNAQATSAYGKTSNTKTDLTQSLLDLLKLDKAA